jgi:uncharacterized protein
MIRFVIVALLVAAHPSAASPACAAEFVAAPGHVVDAAGVLSSAERRHLATRLAEYQRRSGHQIAIVTTAGLGGEDVASYATRLFNRWGIGRRGFDDGVLLLAAPHDQQVRITVGFGLETVLNDAVCKRILDDEVISKFAAGRFADGFDAGVTAVIARLSAAPRSGHSALPQALPPAGPHPAAGPSARSTPLLANR